MRIIAAHQFPDTHARGIERFQYGAVSHRSFAIAHRSLEQCFQFGGFQVMRQLARDARRPQQGCGVGPQPLGRRHPFAE